MGRQLCPHFQTCNDGGLNPITGFQCVILFGIQVAQRCSKTSERTSLSEMEDFRRAEVHPPKRWVVSDDRRIQNHSRRRRAIKFVEKTLMSLSTMATPQYKDLGLLSATFASVVRYAATPEGAIGLPKCKNSRDASAITAATLRRLAWAFSCGAWHY